jgi:lipopolysaccharide export system permease protein
VNLKPRERTTGELLRLDRNDPFVRAIYGRFRSELHDRFTNPLYPIATLAIGFAALGSARTTRQGRDAAIAGAVAALVLMRILGFGAASLAVRSPVGVGLMYLVPLAFTLGAMIVAYRAFRPLKRRAFLAIDWAALAARMRRLELPAGSGR